MRIENKSGIECIDGYLVVSDGVAPLCCHLIHQTNSNSRCTGIHWCPKQNLFIDISNG